MTRLTLENRHLILPGWTFQAESPTGVSFTKEGSSNRWRTIPTMSELSALNISNPDAWDMREGKNQPSELLLKVIITLTTESTIKACMVREGTLLLAPDRDIDELFQKRIPSDNALGIFDLRETSVDWATMNGIMESMQRWFDSMHAGAADKHSSTEEEEEVSDAMEITLTGDAANSVGGAAILLPHLSNKAKTPEHA